MSNAPDPTNPDDLNDPLLGLGKVSKPIETDRYSMDPAQQSLADALRITYRILQVVMLLLVALFLGSGFQTISASERGVKLSFGKITDSDVPPGSVWNWPYPVGEVVRVSNAQQRVNIRRAFFPSLTRDQEQRPREQLVNSKISLVPGVDGSLITADGNIAHTRWEITYRVDRAADYIDNIYQPDEQAIVASSVERGVVRAVAGLEIDSLLRQVAANEDGGAGSVSALSSRVRIIAQNSLDQIGSGIVIEDVILTEKMAPLAVYKVFNDVTTASSKAAKEREDATQFGQVILNGAAGSAYGALLDAIDAYEYALASGDDAQADAELNRINSIIDNEKSFEYEGKQVSISGEVNTIMKAAALYRTTTISEAKSAKTTFQAKIESYRENPEVFLASEMRIAWDEFVKNSFAEIAIFPKGSNLSLTLNRDPEIAEQIERDRNRQQADETMLQRIETQREALRQQQRNNGQ